MWLDVVKFLALFKQARCDGFSVLVDNSRRQTDLVASGPESIAIRNRLTSIRSSKSGSTTSVDSNVARAISKLTKVSNNQA